MTEHGFLDVRWSVRDIFFGTAALFAISVALIPIALAVRASGREDLNPVVTLAASSFVGLLLLVVWQLAIRRYADGGWAAMGVRAPTRSVGFLAIPAILIASVGFTALYEIAVEWTGIEWLIPEALPSDMFGAGAIRVMIVGVTVLLIPFAEELFFRGFLFGGLAARFGVLNGLIVSSAVFAAAHLDVRTMIPIFVAGLLFGWAYHVTKSLWVPIAAHACQNLAALMLLDVM